MSAYTLTGTAIIHEFLDNEIIIANLDSGVYYSIRESGIPLWQLLIANYDVERISQLFHEKYQLTHLPLQTWIDEWVAEGLISKTTSIAANAQMPELFWPKEFKAPSFEKYEEMEELLMLDPIHEVDEQGWPNKSSTL